MDKYLLLCSIFILLASFDKFGSSQARMQSYLLKICFNNLNVVNEVYLKDRESIPRICSRDEITREINSSKLIVTSIVNCFFYQWTSIIQNDNFTGYYIYLYNHDQSCILPHAVRTDNNNLYNNHKGVKDSLIVENSLNSKKFLGIIRNYIPRGMSKYIRPFENNSKKSSKYYLQYNKNGFVTILPNYTKRYQNSIYNKINQNLMDRSTSRPRKLKKYSKYYLTKYKYNRKDFPKYYEKTTMNPYYYILTTSMNKRAYSGFNNRYNNGFNNGFNKRYNRFNYRYNNRLNYRYNNGFFYRYNNRLNYRYNNYRNPMTGLQYTTRNPLKWNRSTHPYYIQKVSSLFWNRWNRIIINNDRYRYSRISTQSTHDHFWRQSYYARFSYFQSQNRLFWLITGFIIFAICSISIIGVLLMKISFDKKKMKIIQKNKTSTDIGIVNPALELDVMPPRYEDLNSNSNSMQNV